MLLLVILLYFPQAGFTAPSTPTTPSIVTVIGAPPSRTLIKLTWGFATVFQFDGPITRVAIGEERLVAAHVNAEQGDLTIKPLQPSGRTNMMVWVGTKITLWELLITRDERTADLIQVITEVPPSPLVADPRAGDPSVKPRSTGRADKTEKKPDSPKVLQASLSKEGVDTVFQAVRLRWGVVIRYRIHNTSGRDLRLLPERILVRANGSIIPYALVRRPLTDSSQDRIPPGGTEVGVISVGTVTESIEVVMPLFPAGSTSTPPIVLEVSFAGISQLPVTSAP